MAQQVKSTHRGHCQICGRLQAVQAPKGVLAKHGYTVKGWGYFMGTCQGSDRLPLQQERTLTDSTCANVTKHAERMEQRVVDLKAGTVTPATCHGAYDPKTRDYVKVPWADATEYQRREAVEREVWSAESEARHARSYVRDMQKLASEVHGQPLVEIK